MKSHALIKDLVDVVNKSLAALDKTSGLQTAKSLDVCYKSLTRIARKLDAMVDVEEADPNDLVALDGHLDNMKEICTRRFHSDIRSWEDREVQKEDARIALQMMKMFWDKAEASKAALPGVPNYRFKIGEQVKVLSSRRSGKVISVSSEGGTGKQVFEIKIPGIDKPKKYYVRQLSKIAKKTHYRD